MVERLGRCLVKFPCLTIMFGNRCMPDGIHDYPQVDKWDSFGIRFKKVDISKNVIDTFTKLLSGQIVYKPMRVCALSFSISMEWAS